MKADCSAKFLMWPKFAFYLEICDPTLNKRHLVIQKSERSLKNMGSPAIAIHHGFLEQEFYHLCQVKVHICSMKSTFMNLHALQSYVIGTF